jgi:hypothetical protein
MILACSILAATLVPLVSRRAVLATAVGLPAPAAASALRPDFLPPPRLPDDATEVTFVVSGSAGPDVYSTEIVAAMQSESRVVLPLDWRTNRRGDSWSIFSSALSAGANGRQYGEAVGREIGERHPRSVHVVAISAGAFAADSLITSARRADPSTYLRLTLLDGFTADGALSAFQDDEAAPGLISFGRDADFVRCCALDPSTSELPSRCLLSAGWLPRREHRGRRIKTRLRRQRHTSTPTIPSRPPHCRCSRWPTMTSPAPVAARHSSPSLLRAVTRCTCGRQPTTRRSSRRCSKMRAASGRDMGSEGHRLAER